MLKFVNKIINAGKIGKQYIEGNGIVAFCEKIHEKLYAKWYEHRYNKTFRNKIRKKRTMNFEYEPLISVVVPTYNTPQKFLKEMIDSVKAQSYGKWELCIADASTVVGTRNELKEIMKTDSRIKVVFLDENKGISGNTNEALKLAAGEYIGLLDHDDLLTEDALYEVVVAINNNNKPDYIYTDEDKIDESGSRLFMPHFKPDYSPDLLYSCNYITHFSIFSRNVLSKNTLFNEQYDGSQDYDLILRLTNSANRVIHIPKVLYHWRCHMNSVALNPSSKDYAYVAARSALQDFNSSKGYKCKVESMKNIGHYKINFDIIGMPKIGIIIRNVKSFNKLKQCLKHLYHCLDYGNVSISIVIDKSLEDRVNELELLYGNEIQIVSINDDKETMVINQLIRKSSNIKYIVLLDSSVRIQDEGWLEQMLMYCQRSDVAVVGGKISYKNGKIKHAGLILDSHKIVQPIYNGSLSNYGGYFLRNRLVQNLSAVSWEFVMIKIQDDIKMLDEVYNIPLAIVNHCLKVNKEKQYVVFNPFAHSIYEGNYCKRDYHIEKMDDIANIKKFKKEWEHQLQSDPYFSKNLRVRGKQVEINVKNGVYL